MTTTTATATETSDNGDSTATDETSETTTTEDTSTETDETDAGEDSNVTPERLKFYQQQARKAEQELKKLRKAEDERARAEMTELDRLKADLAARNEELELVKVTAVKAKLSAEFDLPEELVERLKGDTEEELREDAARLSELVGKVKPKTPPAGDAGIGGKGGDILPTDPVALARRFTGRA